MDVSSAFTKTMNTHLAAAVEEGVFSGAVLLAARRKEILCVCHAGYRCVEPVVEPMKVDTIFDLASLTKPLATATAAMKLVDGRKLGLDEPLWRVLELSPAPGMEDVTARMVLSHCGGFADWMPFYPSLDLLDPADRRNTLRRFLWSLPPAYRPGTRSLYSDPGYILLEWVVEKCSGLPLDRFCAAHYRFLGLKRTFLGRGSAPAEMKDADFAATERCSWRGRVILGEVHDENAFVLGGWSGHAGLFGTAGEVYRLSQLIADHYRGERDDWIRPETARMFLSPGASRCPGSYLLGWDTPTDGRSSSGRYFSGNTVGHLGFTGTSVWMDLERDVIVVLLTNRVHPDRGNEKIRTFRPAIHDAVMGAMGFGGEKL